MSDHIEHLTLLAAQAGAIVIGTQQDIETGAIYLLFEAPLSKELLCIEINEFATYQDIKDKIDAADAAYSVKG